MKLKIAIFSLASLLLVSVAPVLASETTGTLNTGLGGSGVEGVLVTAPTASPVAGSYTSTQSVTLTATGSTSIHYTTSGTDPTCTTGTTYSGAITVSADTTIEAISCYPNSNASTVASFAYDISAGGGGGGSAAKKTETPTIASLTAELNRLIALLAQLQAAAGAPVTPSAPLAPSAPGTSACPYTWTRTLDIGSSGADVLKLQQFLNYSADTMLGAAAGAIGSPGHETSYYGALTGAAVAKFQQKYAAEILTPIGLTSPTTKFGEMSRAKANALCTVAQ